MTQLSRHCLRLKASESRNEKQVEGGGEPSWSAHLQPSLAKQTGPIAVHKDMEVGEAITEGMAGHLPPKAAGLQAILHTLHGVEEKPGVS